MYIPIKAVRASYWGEYCVTNAIMFHKHTPCYTYRAVATVLLSIQPLLQAEEPDDPQDAVVTRQYKEDPELPDTGHKFTLVMSSLCPPASFPSRVPFFLPCLILPCSLNPLVPNCAYMGRPLIIELLLNVILTAYSPCSWAITIHINSPPP